MQNKVIIYQGKSGAIEFKGDLEKETIWASREQIADVFDVDTKTISGHLRTIYNSKELIKNSTSSKYELVQNEVGRDINRKVDFYNLDVIIAVGYRVNNVMGTKFRQWATNKLKTLITDGFVIDRKKIQVNYQKFVDAVEMTKKLLPESDDAFGNKEAFAK